MYTILKMKEKMPSNSWASASLIYYHKLSVKLVGNRNFNNYRSIIQLRIRADRTCQALKWDNVKVSLFTFAREHEKDSSNPSAPR